MKTLGRSDAMRATLIFASTVALASSCQGSVGDPRPQSGGGTVAPPNGGSGTTVSPCQTSDPGTTVQSPLQRLSRTEYIQTTSDLLSDRRAVGQTLPADDTSDLASGSRSLIGTWAWLNQAMQAAEDLAAAAVKSISTLAPCPAGNSDDGCARSFIAGFGKRAFRRPVTPDEVTALMGIFALGKTNGDYGHGIELVTREVLLSPAFLYKVELGVPGSARNGTLRLTGYEVATRLSYMLWGTTPGDDLLALADAGGLSSTVKVREQATRLLQDARAHEPIVNLHQRWLDVSDLADVSKDPVTYPTFGAPMLASMQREAHDFLNDVIWNRGATLDTLFTSTTTQADPTLASLYAGQTP